MELCDSGRRIGRRFGVRTALSHYLYMGPVESASERGPCAGAGAGDSRWYLAANSAPIRHDSQRFGSDSGPFTRRFRAEHGRPDGADWLEGMK